MKDKTLIIYIDGACRGNPGPASYGVSIQDKQGNVYLEVNDYIGEATNSVAEYRALIRALEEGQKWGGEELVIYTDSQLVVRQFEGTYRVKHENMRSLLSEVRKLEKNFKSVSVHYVPRSTHPGNKRADQLANIALNKLGL